MAGEDRFRYQVADTASLVPAAAAAVVPPVPVVAASVVNKPVEAFARYEPRSVELAKPVVKARRHVAKRVRNTRFAAYRSSPENWIATW